MQSIVRRTNTRRLAAVALATSLALTLTACGSDSDDSAKPTATASATDEPQSTEEPTGQPEPTAEDIAALESVKIEGAPGSEPTITLPSTPFTTSAAVARIATPGEGDALVDGDIVEVQVTAVNGSDGSSLGSTYQDGRTNTWKVSGEGNGLRALDEALLESAVGAQLVLSLPSTDAEGQSSTSVYVFEPIRKISKRAEGTAVAPVDGLPTVTLADDGAPTITAAPGDAPTELVVQPLIEGAGKVVETGDNLLVQYQGVLWDGKTFDSSWERNDPFTVQIGQGQVITGWDEGLVGQKVGSQVLLVVPPDKGYGDQESGEIPPGSTLVFVVDILWAA